jgi:nucleolar complex protein 2
LCPPCCVGGCAQTLLCLELWVKVLAAAPSQGTLQPLVYPTTQLLLGAARLVPTPRYFPIRLRLVRALNKLAQVSLHVYVPGSVD